MKLSSIHHEPLHQADISVQLYHATTHIIYKLYTIIIYNIGFKIYKKQLYIKAY